MNVRAKHRLRFTPNLLLLITAIYFASPAVADGLYGAGYQFQRAPRTPSPENDRFFTSSPTVRSSASTPAPSVSGKTLHPASGPGLHDHDRTTDPWFVTDEDLAKRKKTIETATEQIKKSPQDAVAYIERSDAYLHVWMSNLALEDASKAISLNPDTALRRGNAYCNKGEALLQLDKYAEALEALNQAISIDDENAEAYYFRGMAQEKLGHIDIAIKDYQQARDFGFAPKAIDVDFGEFMANLQRSIKKEWHPPKGNETRKTMVTFKIHRNGLLDNLKLMTDSGLEPTNEAALDAVRSAAPFQHLPKGAPRSVDIQFAFDYNVIKKSEFTDEKINALTNAEKDAQQRVEAAEKADNQKVLIDALFSLGDAYREKRNFYYAENSYKRAQELSEKSNDDSARSAALARLALVDMGRGKKREAEELFNKSLDIALKAGKLQTDPDTGLVLRDYAKLLYKENRFDDVKKMYARFKVI